MTAKLRLVDNLDFDDEDLEDEPDLEAPPGGFQPLGVDGKSAVVFSLMDKSVVKFAPSAMGELNLKMSLGAAWCDYFAKAAEQSTSAAKKPAGKKSSSKLASHIIASCQEAGPYLPAKERRTGVWRDVDGSLIVNSVSLWRPDGSVLSHGVHGDFVYPIAKPVGFDANTRPASQDDIEQLLVGLRSFAWSTPFAAELVLGWFGIATIATAVRRRPHLLVTGPAGCGKSTLLERVSQLLGDNIVRFTGSPTAMGINQTMEDRPNRAIAIDEFECDTGNSRCRQVFEVARGAYSLQEGDAGVVRGAPGGEAKTYRVSSPFIAAGISPGRMEPADATRWVVLEAMKMASVADGAPTLLSESEAVELGPRLSRLFINRWDMFQGSLEPIRAAIQGLGGDARLADSYGYLLAAYWSFVSDQAASAADAERIVDESGVAAQISKPVAQDQDECLNVLMTRVLPFEVLDEGCQVSRKLSIGEAVRLVAEDRRGTQAIAARLAQLGLRVAVQDNKRFLFVANSPSHSELRKLFAGSKWSRGGWGLVLRRLPGGIESTQRLGRALPSCKVTIFDLPAWCLPEGATAKD